jgi:hypothetical protein
MSESNTCSKYGESYLEIIENGLLESLLMDPVIVFSFPFETKRAVLQKYSEETKHRRRELTA